jgi:hypothetical protein
MNTYIYIYDIHINIFKRLSQLDFKILKISYQDDDFLYIYK